jgi:hypothetical protein
MNLKNKIRNRWSKFKETLKSNRPKIIREQRHKAGKEALEAVNKEAAWLQNEVDELLEEGSRLREELARREGAPTGGGGTPQPTDDSLIRELEAENYLLREASKALIKEKAELKKVIASLESDKQQQKEEFEKKLAQSQRSIENIEYQLVDCCDRCLAEEEETKEGLNKAKKDFFELCEGLGIEISSQLKEDIEKSSTYKELLSNLSKIHNEKMIEINQQTSEETKPAEVSQTEASSSSSSWSKTNSGTKYFLWITGILALISFILFVIKKGKLGVFRAGKR